MVFKKAERKQAKLKIALTGPSGSGKTFSALSLAAGIGKKIALVDTENGSASLYADRFQFDTVTIPAPYTIGKYIEAIRTAQDAGYDVLIIDSISHAWAGDGGLLAKKESLDSRGGNQYTNWASISKEHEEFKSRILNAQLHLICTMRSKQDYVLELNDKGKSAPKKVGMAPIQRDGMEYEFTTVFDIAMDHVAVASKDRTGLFDGQMFKLEKETGGKLMKWLSEAKAEDVPPPQPPAPVQPVASAPAVEPPPAAPPVELPKTAGSGAFCAATSCQSELILHKSGQGYLCPKAGKPGDGHSRVNKDKLAEFKAKQTAPMSA